jgi:transcriptional regulator with XRE-family HTH domain
MARAALQIGVRDLAELAKVSPSTVARLEAGEELKERTVEAVRSALEVAGVAFTNGGEPGVKLRPLRVGDWVRLVRGTMMWGDAGFADVRDQPAVIVAFVDDGTSMERITVRWENGRQEEGIAPGFFQRTLRKAE